MIPYAPRRKQEFGAHFHHFLTTRSPRRDMFFQQRRLSEYTTFHTVFRLRLFLPNSVSRRFFAPFVRHFSPMAERVEKNCFSRAQTRAKQMTSTPLCAIMTVFFFRRMTMS